MNIHFIAGDRVTAAVARQRGLSVRSGKGTKAPRSRGENPVSGGLRLDTRLAHNAYPGGKRYRKAMAELKRRVDGVQPGNCKRPDRISSRDDTPPWGSFGFTKPGSMKA